MSWEGWVVMAVSLVGIGAVVRSYGEKRGTPAVLAIVAAVGLVCWLKGTSPGSGRARAEFDRIRGRERSRLVKGWRPPPDPSPADIVNKRWPSDEQ